MASGRSRKTAEKLASYKAAARKGNIRHNSTVGGKPVSVRVSPRRKNEATQRVSAAPPVSKLNQARRGSPRQSSDSIRTPEKRKPVENRNDENQESEDKGFAFLEEIPETPPRITPSAGRVGRSKRVHPPRPNEYEPDSGDESDKPSKKRKTFTTPPRCVSHDVNNNVDHHTPRPSNDLRIRAIQRSLDDSVSDVVEAGEGFDTPTDRMKNSGISNAAQPRSSDRADKYRPRKLADRSRHISKGFGIAERSALVDEDLEVLQVSSATISRLLESHGRSLISEFAQMQRENIAEMRKIADGVMNSVSSEMKHFEGIVSMMTRGMGGGKSTKSNGKTSLNEWEQKLNSLTPDTDFIFNKDVLGMLMCYNTPIQAAMVFRKQAGSDLKKAALSAQTLLFSLQPGDKKFSYSGQVGGLHSEFKFTIVQNAFFNVLRDTFKMFRTTITPGSTEDSRKEEFSSPRCRSSRGDSDEGSDGLCKLIKRPLWLESKVTKDHINEARNFLERPNQSRKGRVRNTPSPYDVACHGALRVYRLLGSYLHVRRGAVRSTFFQGIGYLLVPWSQLVKDVDQDTLNMSWSVEDGNELNLDLDDVPYSEHVGFVTDHSAVTSADANNKSLLRQLFSDWPGMVLTVEHDVFVVGGNGVQRKHSGGERTTIRRLFNLIDIACDFCVDYCGAGTRENFLRGQRYSLRCIMIFAMLFKAFCMEFIAQSEEMRSSAASGSASKHQRYPEPSELEVEGMCLKDLIPGPTTQKNLLECRCLRMTRSEFNTYNHSFADADGDNELNGDGPDFDMMEIEESEEIGIGAL